MSATLLNAVLTNSKARGSRRTILMILAWRTNPKTGRCNLHMRTIAKQARMSLRQVKRVIAGLRSSGRIKTTRVGPNRALHFFIAVAGAQKRVVSSATPGGVTGDIAVVTSATPGGVTGDTAIERIPKRKKRQSSSALRATTTTGSRSKIAPATAVKEKPPTRLDVERLFEKRGFKSSPKEFWDWNQEKGWIGISATESWQSLARKWEARQRKPRYAPEQFVRDEEEPKGWQDPDDPGTWHFPDPNLSKAEQARWIADVTNSR